MSHFFPLPRESSFWSDSSVPHCVATVTGKVLAKFVFLCPLSKLVFVFLFASNVVESSLKRGAVLHIFSCPWVFA